METDWSWPGNWPELKACRRLHVLLAFGWKLPPEDREPLFGEGGGWSDATLANRQRARYWDNRHQGRRLPRVEVDGVERPVRFNDPREVWESTDLDGDVLDSMFPPSRDNRGGPLHRWLTRSAAERVVSEVADALEHLEALPTAGLAGHFDENYGESWPPYLKDVHDMLLHKWQRNGADLSPGRRAYERTGTALRVAAVLPIGVTYRTALDPPAGKVEDVIYRECDWTPEQIRQQLY